MIITLIYGMTEISSNKEAGFVANFSIKHQTRAQKVHLKKEVTYSRVMTNSFTQNWHERIIIVDENDCKA